MSKNAIQTTIVLLLTTLLLSIVLFGHLDTLAIRIWDESRLAVNAQDALLNNNYLVPHFRGKPEMWNTKPTLLISLQALSMKLFGMNELAIRLPSAFAGLGVCLGLILFSWKHLKLQIGILAAFILVTTAGYVGLHVTRTGDFDALLTVFTTTACLSFFVYTQNRMTRYIQVFYISLGLGVLAKSIVILLFIPGIALYILLTKSCWDVLKDKRVYTNSLLFLVPVIGYYVLREQFNPGYIQAVIDNEITGRYLSAIETHNQSISFYFDNLLHGRYAYWIYILPIALVFGFFTKDSFQKQLHVFLSICVVLFFTIISTAESKLAWYDAPIYPLLAILIAMFLYRCIHIVISKIAKPNSKLVWVETIAIVILVAFPYYQKVQAITHTKELAHEEAFYSIEYFLRDAENVLSKDKAYFVAYDGYDVQVEFYTTALRQQGYNIDFGPVSAIKQTDFVIAHQPEVIEYIQENYDWTFQKYNGFVLAGEIVKK